MSKKKEKLTPCEFCGVMTTKGICTPCCLKPKCPACNDIVSREGEFCNLCAVALTGCVANIKR